MHATTTIEDKACSYCRGSSMINKEMVDISKALPGPRDSPKNCDTHKRLHIFTCTRVGQSKAFRHAIRGTLD